MKIKKFVVEIIRGEKRGFLASLFKTLLTLLSYCYQFLTSVRMWAYDRGYLKVYKTPLFVISVGNIVAGGSGKTPFVIELTKSLLKEHKVCILLRGYKGSLEKNKQPFVVEADTPFHLVGDEAVLLKRNLPNSLVIACKDRLAGAELALQLGATLAILDDGFQHRRIARDRDIVIVNSLKRDYFLPRGFLRESPKALKRATEVVINGCEPIIEEDLRKITIAPISYVKNEVRGIFGFDDRPLIESIRGKNVAIFSGIGQPERFFKTVEGLGCNVVMELKELDHKSPSFAELEKFTMLAKKKGAAYLLCTEKDRIKMKNETTLPLPIGWVGIELKSVVSNGS